MSEPSTEPRPEERSTDVGTELSRDMSLADITFIGVGAMIGAGIFALTGYAAGIAGPALTLAFVLNGFVALFTAVSYAELGAAFPEAGGGYLWVQEALAEPNGFYAGWMSWFAHAVACALYAVTFGVYFTEFVVTVTPLTDQFVLFGFLPRIATEKGLAALVAVAFAYINYRGAEETGRAEVIVVAIKLLILGLFVAFGVYATLTTPDWPAKFLSNPSFAPSGLIGIIGAMGFTYIAFEGYEIIVQSGEEVVDPGTNIPKAVFYSLLIVVPIYVFVAFAAIGGIDATASLLSQSGVNASPASYPTWQLLGKLGELGIVQAADQFLPFGALLLLVAGVAATSSALNATVYSSSRVSFAMGRNRELPAFFERIHPERRTPHVAIAISLALIVVMAVSLPIESVAAASDIMFILLFIQVNWTLIRMRTTHPDLPRTFVVPFMPWPAVAGIVFQLLLLPFLVYELGLEAIGIGQSNDGLVALGVTAVWMALGLFVFYGYSRDKQAERREEETPTVVAEEVPAAREGRIVVPIANPESVEPLVRTAIDLARDRNAELRVMSAVTVPQETPLDLGRRFVDEERVVLDEAIGLAEELAPEVPVSGTIRIGHDVTQAILNTVEQDDADLLLIGWRGRRWRRRDIVFGDIVDGVVTQATCDVLVERISPVERIESVLVPTAGGSHAMFAAEVARAVARQHGASIHLVSVVSPDADEVERDRMSDILAEIADGIGNYDTVETRLLEGTDVVGSVVAESAAHDVTVVGATAEGVLQRLVFGAVPEEIGRHAHGTVLMAKRRLSLSSQVGQSIRSARPNSGDGGDDDGVDSSDEF